MINKHWIILATLLILLIGCGPVSLEHEAQEKRQPIDLSNWPTPPAQASTPTPTPFPKTTLAPIPTQTVDNSQTASQPASALDLSGNPTQLVAQVSALTGGLTPVGVITVSADESALRQSSDSSADIIDTLSQGTLAAALGKSENGDWVYVITQSLNQGWLPLADTQVTLGNLGKAPLLPPDQLATASQNPAPAAAAPNLDAGLITELASAGGNLLQTLGLRPVAVAFTTQDDTAVRQRPAGEAGLVSVKASGEIMGILGKNPAGDWVYVITINRETGWIPLASLRVVGDLSAAPSLPADPLAAALARLNPPAAGSGSNTAGPAVDVNQLETVALARVNNPALNLRQRPGAGYKLLDTLNQGDAVAILGVNRDGEWALVKTANNRLGWASVDFLEADGSLAGAPQLRTLPPSNSDPAGQVAPMALVSEAAGQPVADAPAAPQPQPAAVSAQTPADSGLNLPANTLAAVANGKGAEKIELRRGPGNSYGPVAELTVDESLQILAVNRQRDWTVVKTALSEVGWAPLSSLTITEGSIENAAVVTTAWVKSNALEVKDGPGIYFNTVGTLAIDNLVSIIALDEGRSWALVETLTGGQGWLPLRFLDSAGPLEQIPQIPASRLAQSPASSGPALPAPVGPPGGKLVFQTSSGGDIMLINADGSGLRRLTSGIDPVLSRDGQKVAFTRWQGDTGTLWTINTDGTNERAVLGETRKAKGADWSPDDSQIVLNFQHGGRVEDKRDCNTLSEGSGANIPRNATNVSFDISDEGRLVLCFTLPPDPYWSLRVVNLADGSFEDKYGGTYAFRPAWDPANPWRIISDSGNGILAVDVNREAYRQPLTTEINDGSPVFSPDGRFIAVVTDVQGGHDIFRMNADGSGRARLTQTPLWVPVQPSSSGQQWNNVSPAWSPDGSQLAFLTDRAGRWEIWIMNADGSNQRPMFSDEINNQLNITYEFVDERALSWR